MESRDVEYAIRQLDQLNDDRTPAEILFEYQGMQRKLYDLKLEGESVRIIFIPEDFDFGDGYYESNSPPEWIKESFLISISHPTVAHIVEAIMSEWEDWHFPYVESSSDTPHYVEAVHRLKREAIVKEKLEKLRARYLKYAEHDNPHMPAEENARMKQSYIEIAEMYQRFSDSL